MNTKVVNSRSFSLVCGLVLLLSGTSLAFGQVPSTQVIQDRTANVRSVPSGARMKFQGVVIERSGDAFTIRDRTRTDYQVLITDSTSIKTYGGFLRSGKKYPVTDILRGLIVEVEGRGDPQGQIVAGYRSADLDSALSFSAPKEHRRSAPAHSLASAFGLACDHGRPQFGGRTTIFRQADHGSASA